VTDVLEQVRLVARRMALDVHNVAVQDISGHIYVALDLEVAPDLSLGQAHALASGLEARLREDIPGIARIDSHIEPRPQAVSVGRDVTAQSPGITAAVRDAVHDLPLVAGCHGITVLQSDGKYDVSVHCTFERETSIGEVHRAADEVSRRVREAVPSVNRVIVHAEP
jgi:divalent metal cation (Fe/Co/Zn/Cd) transporter